jgi:hypothetical protein
MALPLLLFPWGGLAQEPGVAQRVIFPWRAEISPVIDGVLDDPVWREAPSVSGFETYMPDYGAAMVGDTRVYMAYDGADLYFAFHAMDPEPERIKSSITDRDNIRRDDWVAINLDTFGDQQSLYAFYVNPSGIQMDTRFAGGQEDPHVDLVWYSQAVMDETGYSVEMQIPLKSIRFSPGDSVRMGVIFERFVSREQQAGTYPRLDPAQGESWLTQMMPLVYRDLDHESLVEVLPAFTYTNRQEAENGRLETKEDRGEVSLTAKYGITSDLVLDGTYNPDFSQVEADAGQVDVNLRYQLYFPEKRAFFREGGEHFAVGATGASALDPVSSIVYTRTIVDPVAGVKLTGKLGPRDFLASIYSVDDLAPEPGSGDPEFAHVPILRYKRSLSRDGYLGAIYSGREAGDHYNRVGGADGFLRMGSATTLGFHAILSDTEDGEEGIEDSGGRGRALGFHLRRSTRDLDVGLVGKDVSEDFRSETGYVWRTGIYQVSGRIRPKFYPESDVLRRVDLELFSGQTKDRPSGEWETLNQASVNAFLLGKITLRGAFAYATEIYRNQEFDTGGFTVSGSGQLTNDFFASLSFRRRDAIYYSGDPFQGRSDRIGASVGYQPSEKLRTDFNYTYVDFDRASDQEQIYDYSIYWSRVTYQLNRYLFFRGIVEYNDYRKELLTDFLASFTYIPGTVVHLGYGSLREKSRWIEGRGFEQGSYVDSDDFTEMKRSFFLKMSYLWRR